MNPPELQKLTCCQRSLFWVRTVSGVMVSRPTPGQALRLYEEQEEKWREAQVEVSHV